MGLYSFLDVLKEVASLLNESRKLSLKNKKLIFSVLVLPLLLNGLVYLSKVFVIKPKMLSTDSEFVVSSTCIFVVSSCIFSTVSFITDLVSVLTIVHASSALTRKDENININDLPVLTLKSLKRPLITSFHIFLSRLRYSFLFFPIFFPLLLFSTKPYFLVAKSGASLIRHVLFLSYLDIVWHLSMVISILDEETYGTQALRKAKKIVKGMRPKLFLLNVFFGLLSSRLDHIVRRIDSRRSFAVTLTTGLVIVSLIFAVRMFQLVTYTVAYCQRNKCFQGKDVESLKDV